LIGSLKFVNSQYRPPLQNAVSQMQHSGPK
jgi:hypothetical protein